MTLERHRDYGKFGPTVREQRDGAQEIIELIMSAHYDIVACQCWICATARTLGFGNRGLLPRTHPLWRALAGSVGNFADVFTPSSKEKP